MFFKMKVLRLVSLSALFLLIFASPSQAARLKDIADIEGVRGNQLVGYGVVVGLQGTGDKQGAVFTGQSMANMLERMGIRVPSSSLTKLANVAGVVVTADLPPFARNGTKIDVTLSSIGDASSLQGGVLVMTPLTAADGETYAVAQGPVSLGGFIVEGGGNVAQKNHPTVARISNGATIEKSIPFDLFSNGTVRIVLRDPDFTTITRVQAAVNEFLNRSVARATDSASVIVPLDGKYANAPVHLIAKLEDIEIAPDTPARVVLNERTGTIIMGENVRVSTVALAHGSLNITIKSEDQVSQPNPLAPGETEIVNNQEVEVGEEFGRVSVVEGTVSLGNVVDALNGLGASPRDMIAIFQALQRAGALQAELVLM